MEKYFKLQWQGTDEEFIELIQRALVLNKLSCEQPQGWLLTAVDQTKTLGLANVYGYDRLSVLMGTEQICKRLKDQVKDSSMSIAFRNTMEEEINRMINESKQR